jgi:starvation-inducible DNA-binding protein
MTIHTTPREPLAVAPRETDPNTGVEHKHLVAGGLADVLADTYLLLIKTHAHHWNVMGPLFYSIHNLTEEQYEEMFEAVDVMAERVRALGSVAPANVAEMLKRSDLGESRADMTAGDMIADLASDHEKLARRLHKLASAAGDAEDIVTEDLAVARSTFHEKAAWMLRAMIAE